MKKLTLILTGVFVIAGTSAIGLATSGDNENEVSKAVVTSGNEENTTETIQVELDDTSTVNETDRTSERRISGDEAVAIAQEMLDGTVDEVELDTEDGILVYEVELEYKGDDYDFKIDAHTGDIIKIDDDLMKTSIADNVTISVEEAKQIVMDLFPEGKIDDIELEMKQSRYVYEMEVEYKDEEGDIYIDAETGDVLKVEDDLTKLLEREEGTNERSDRSTSLASGQSGERISYEEAEEIALNHVGKGYIDDIELERENGRLLFEVEVEYGDNDFDVYIDAVTGEVMYVD
ncbi:PepSY domain-containing protein [Salipaludibacillus sp. HK11]|uniref:PepSY domain-containing protein n=1 Tax=Salipaludibacillus sp. HK11 TaxID=3394320 RepID=UPI0039FCEFEA